MTGKDIRIREMTMADLDAVTAIEAACFSMPWSRQGFADALRQDAIFLVAEADVPGASDRRIAGYIGMYCAFDEGEITNVAVAEECRGLGIATELVRALITRAGACGVKRIVLEVRRSNRAAIHVYECCGFGKLGVRRDFYERPREDADIMVFEG